MRTEKEIAEALLHLRQAMTACPEEERDGSSYAMAEHFCLVLSWVLKREEGQMFEQLMAGMRAVDDVMSEVLRKAIDASLSAGSKETIQ